MLMRLALAGILAAIGVMTTSASAQSWDFARLFTQYRGLEAEEALREFATWSEVRVVREAATAPAPDDPRSLAAFVLFHTEAGLMKETLGRPRTDLPEPTQGPMSNRWEVHYRTSQALVDRLMQTAGRSKDAALLAFCHNWYIVANSARPNLWGPPSDFDTFKRRAGDSAEMQIVIGASAIAEMGPRELDGPLTRGHFWGIKDGNRDAEPVLIAGSLAFLAVPAREAELAFRRALKLDPTFTEARLRLGRHFQVLNRPKDTLKELEPIVTATTPVDSFSRYLAPLFLGALYEDEGRLADAVAAYRQSVASHPQAVTARLALGEALIVSGFAVEGLAALRSAFGEGAGPHQPARDPFSYLAGLQDRKTHERLASMRAMVSKTPRAPRASANRAMTRLVGDAPIEPPAGGDVRLDVMVTLDDKPVTGLTPADFIVIDNQVRQTVTSARVAGKVSAALVLDTSPSATRVTLGRSVGAIAESALAAFLPDDDVSVVTVSDRIALMAERVRPAAARQVVAAVRSETDGMTALWDAVLASRSLVMNTGGRPIVIVASDGADNLSWFRRPRALTQLKRAGLVVDAVEMPYRMEPGCRPKCEFDFTYGPVTLRDLENATGGVVVNAEDPALTARLQERMAALRAGYVLTYTPTNMLTTAGWHDVKVTLKPGVAGKIEARPGYYGREGSQTSK